MTVSIDDIKKLREMTNAGMMDCKKTLEEAKGDIDEALKILKQKGLADAKKRSDRETKEGGVYIKRGQDKIVIILLGCETDFVSRNELFIAAKDKILDKMLTSGNPDIAFYKDELDEVISKTKENLEFKKAKVINLKESQYASTYIHGANKIGVVAVFDNINSGLKEDQKFKELANNICLHIAANAPYYISKENIPKAEFDEQKEIAKKQIEGTNKPADIIEKILEGKLSKYAQEVCLLTQKYVKDDKITVEKYIKDVSKELQADIKLVDFTRFMIGK
jgi:elongation factor Ts